MTLKVWPVFMVSSREVDVGTRGAWGTMHGGHVRTFTVLQGSATVHQEGVQWPRASTLPYPADAPTPEISRDSVDSLVLVTTHPTNLATQAIPSAPPRGTGPTPRKWLMHSGCWSGNVCPAHTGPLGGPNFPSEGRDVS